MQDIKQILQDVYFINEVKEYNHYESNTVECKIVVMFEELNNPLEFELLILPTFPFKSQNSESIRFTNKKLG